MKLKIYTGTEVRELRRKRGLSQREFWQCFHITQGGGRRYEAGCEIPMPMQLLLNITFGTQTQSTACVDALRALAKMPQKTMAPKPVTVPVAFDKLPFGMLP
ncbi:MAG: XRE family transcriptional regulator [Rhodocyclales bacterium]|nr:XRE family transcriptional regulator [Rhodocyclales bacterium]